MSVKLLAGRYELLDKIGDGGMAVVYKARCRLLNRFVAIKILKPEFVKDPKVIDNFRKESQAAAGLNHPNIVNIYDVGREGNVHYIVMELIEGCTLSELIAEEGPMEYHKVINITKQIASGLAFAHKNNIIHRDIKPHNVLITEDGIAKIADFGIAKAMSESKVSQNDSEEMIMGSVHYFSPEQARGGYIDAKSDIYSLGIVMFEMLTARVPFDAETPVQVALMHMNQPMVPPSQYVSGIPPRLESILMKCTDKLSVNRYSSAEEIIDELDTILKLTRIVGEAAIDPEHFTVDNSEKKEPKREAEDRKERIKKAKMNEKKNNKKKFIIGGVAVLVIAVICVFVFGGVSEVKVPDVKGLTYQEAEDVLEEKGLKIKEGNRVFSDKYEEDQIVSQSPKSGMKVKKGTTISVNISKGKGTEMIPSVIGMTEDEAKKVLESKGFTVGTVTEQESDKAEGTVIEQSPGAGTEANEDTPVSLVIAKKAEEKSVKVPGLLGKSLDDAKSAIENAGLTVGNVTYGYSEDYPKGQVIEQSKQSGSDVKEGTSINIKVSKGPQPQEEEPDEGDDEWEE